jgi:hypothetical protein
MGVMWALRLAMVAALCAAQPTLPRSSSIVARFDMSNVVDASPTAWADISVRARYRVISTACLWARAAVAACMCMNRLIFHIRMRSGRARLCALAEASPVLLSVLRFLWAVFCVGRIVPPASPGTACCVQFVRMFQYYTALASLGRARGCGAVLARRSLGGGAFVPTRAVFCGVCDPAVWLVNCRQVG